MLSRLLPHDWFPSPLPGNVVIGQRSWCYSAFAFVHCRSLRASAVRVGRDSGIYAGCMFELGPTGEVDIGDYCTLVGATISTNGRVVIGNYAFIAHDVVLADSFCPVPPLAPAHSSAATVAGELVISISNDVWIGARAVILGGAHLAEGVIVGAGAVVDFPVPPYAIVAGNPARVVGQARGAHA
jgi:acetyltransferase-like isoleucine patch superfamily enzyme